MMELFSYDDYSAAFQILGTLAFAKYLWKSEQTFERYSTDGRNKLAKYLGNIDFTESLIINCVI